MSIVRCNASGPLTLPPSSFLILLPPSCNGNYKFVATITTCVAVNPAHLQLILTMKSGNKFPLLMLTLSVPLSLYCFLSLSQTYLLSVNWQSLSSFSRYLEHNLSGQLCMSACVYWNGNDCLEILVKLKNI